MSARGLIASQQLSPFSDSVRCLSVSLPSLQLRPFLSAHTLPLALCLFKLSAHRVAPSFIGMTEKKELEGFTYCSQYNYILLLDHSLKRDKWRLKTVRVLPVIGFYDFLSDVSEET